MFSCKSLYLLISFIDPIDENESSSRSLQEPIDGSNSSNLSADQTAVQKHTETQANSQPEENPDDDLGWLEEKTNQENKLTDQEIVSRKNSLFRLLNKVINTIHQSLSSENEVWKIFMWISNFIFTVQKIGPLPVDVLNKYRREAGQQLSKSKSVQVICKVVTEGWQTCTKQLLCNAVEQPSNIMLAAMSVLWNYSDCSPEVTFDIITEASFLNTLREILTFHLHERIQGEEMSKEKNKMIGASLSIIHNLSKVDENITPLREGGFVNCVSLYLDSKVLLDRFKALATLASLIDEKECEMLQGKDELLKMFLESLETALQTSNRICLVNEETWSAWECTLTIHRLARNHANKPLLVQMGCLPHLTKLAKIGTTEEIREAVGTIWYLAFDKNNQIKMHADKELNTVDLLTDIKEKSEDRTTKEAADGTIRLLRDPLQNNQKNKDKVRASVRQESSSDVINTKQKKGHIMISYNWSHKTVLIQIRDKLKAHGYAVWMDIDNMGGSTLEAMAEAVEKAHVVLICMSQKYKDSKNCKKEAEYAYQWQKEVVALKMEKDYKPNGWLGFIVGADLFYDFSGRYEFETKCEELLKRMEFLYGEDRPEINYDEIDAKPVSITPRSVARPNHQSSIEKLREWTQKQVNDWLDRYHLPKDVLGHLTGKDLAALIRMKDTASEYFYRCLEKKLKLESLSMMDTFIEALDHL
ncbi:hypothetical protein ACJMK2_014777 [Sinanodonta woodiana]|uniref:TIR domain-containing protein n=1 Tax=Sinanodonta woodiana TaxID=1069815 RepID=A0ABD3V2C5_SINWO